MTDIIVVGAQWGDEGKGKIVDWLAEKSRIVVRYQGGHNAGHTLVIDGQTFKLSLLPSGIVRDTTISLIGSGVVVDPLHLLKEIETLRAQGLSITAERLRIAPEAALILPLHAELDKRREQAASKANKIGTTGRGIGPAYEDRAARRAIRAGDLLDLDYLRTRIDVLLSHHNALCKGMGYPEFDADALFALLADLATTLRPYIGSIQPILEQAAQSGEHVVYEGAQGLMLDISHGTYPFVTSSNTLPANAAIGSGWGAARRGYVLGIAKAYTTRVGEGPFPTELFDTDGQRLGERGHEFGVVTGRKRRCGWFDAVMVRQAIKTAGIDGIALTKIDVLSDFAQLAICTSYQLDGRSINSVPANAGELARIVPQYETMPGWSEDISGIQDFEHLPQAAKNYLKRLEALIGVPIVIVSTSPKREDSIWLHDIFNA